MTLSATTTAYLTLLEDDAVRVVLLLVHSSVGQEHNRTQPVLLSPLDLSRQEMGKWELTSTDLKQYPHFDAPLSAAKANALARDPERVRKHGFFPFLLYANSWWRFGRKTENNTTKKKREIRYASRADSYIYSYYRSILSESYEKKLRDLGISDCVIAYRKIPATDNVPSGGKSNIHFAAEAFDRISSLGNCCAVALDIHQFFDSMDHSYLGRTWCDLLGVSQLPPDHAAVFKSISQYADIDRNLAYERLGLARRRKNGSWQYLRTMKMMSKQLCSPADFRKKICRAAPKLIRKNSLTYGIPQGAPISDLLANAYLLQFDVSMASYVSKRGGFYLRYSDDILLVLPGDGRAGKGAREYATRCLRDTAANLTFNVKKTSTVRFYNPDGPLQYKCLDNRRSNGLEYLGFRFDGKRVYLRNSTISNLNRKIVRALHAETRSLIRRYRGKHAEYIVSHFNLEEFLEKFSRKENFASGSGFENWTFWTYAHRAAKVFGRKGTGIYRQLRNQRSLIQHRAKQITLRSLDKTNWSETENMEPQKPLQQHSTSGP